MTSFILLLTIIIDTHFAPLKDLSKAFASMTNDKWQMTNDKLQSFQLQFTIHNLIFSYL